MSKDAIFNEVREHDFLRISYAEHLQNLNYCNDQVVSVIVSATY
jgi:hypothetical protein